MINDEMNKYVIRDDKAILDAMQLIDQNGVGLVYAVDDNNRLTGCLTDGDVRRWILKNGSISARVYEAMNHSPKYIYENMVTAASDRMKKEIIYSLAVIDEDHQIVNVIFDESVWHSHAASKKKTIVNTPIIIMAGGKGTRLYPYTKVLPKPLIPIGDVPILERILNNFNRRGVDEFWLSVNYKKEIIKSYFSDISPSYSIHYVEEPKPLGTAGSIRLLEGKFDRPIIIANCDSLIDADYGDIIEFHNSNGNDLTVVSSLKNLVIPYGVLHTKKDGIISSIEEKPRLSYFINTGMYIMNPDLITRIPMGKVYHMPQLVEELINDGKRVGMYPISEESFLDMGEFEEMKKMEDRINISRLQ